MGMQTTRSGPWALLSPHRRIFLMLDTRGTLQSGVAQTRLVTRAPRAGSALTQHNSQPPCHRHGQFTIPQHSPPPHHLPWHGTPHRQPANNQPATQQSATPAVTVACSHTCQYSTRAGSRRNKYTGTRTTATAVRAFVQPNSEQIQAPPACKYMPHRQTGGTLSRGKKCLCRMLPTHGTNCTTQWYPTPLRMRCLYGYREMIEAPPFWPYAPFFLRTRLFYMHPLFYAVMPVECADWSNPHIFRSN